MFWSKRNTFHDSSGLETETAQSDRWHFDKWNHVIKRTDATFICWWIPMTDLLLSSVWISRSLFMSQKVKLNSYLTFLDLRWASINNWEHSLKVFLSKWRENEKKMYSKKQLNLIVQIRTWMQTWNHLAWRRDAKAVRHFCLSRTSGGSMTVRVSIDEVG